MQQRLSDALKQFRQLYAADVAAAEQMIGQHDRFAAALTWDDDRKVELASMTMLVHSLLNLDRARTRE
jgi:hypothetical protein